MGRPKKSAPKHVEPEFESQEIEDEEPAVVIEPEEEDEPAGHESNGKISKADAVREALAQGKEGPENGTDYIFSQYGIEMTRQMFSSYKAQEKARLAKKAETAPKKPERAKPGRKPKAAAPAVSQAPAPAKAAPATNGETDLLESLETLKPLIASMGAEKVKRLVDLLG